MKHMYANGDSYTHGDELGGDTPRSSKSLGYRRDKCFVGQLAKLFELSDWTNDAIGGSSNDRIFRRTMQFTSKWLTDGNEPEDLFVIVGWSHSARNEFYCDENAVAYSERDDNKHLDQPELDGKYFASLAGMEKTTRLRFPNDSMREFVIAYNTKFNVPSSAMTRTINHIAGLQGFLKSKRIPYLFFNAGWVIDTDNCESGCVVDMIDTHRFLGLWDRNDTLSGWTWNNGYRKRMPRGHPDEAAHEGWARHLHNYIVRYNLTEPGL